MPRSRGDRGPTPRCARPPRRARTSHLASQRVAPVPQIYARVHPPVPVRFAEPLAASATQWPVDDLWHVGHRAVREVPRVAAVWSFLVERLRGA